MKTHSKAHAAALSALLTLLASLFAFPMTAHATVDTETAPSTVVWGTTNCLGNNYYSSPSSAIDSFTQCNDPCTIWGAGNEASPDLWEVSVTIYQTCQPPIIRDPITQYSGLVNAGASCTDAGYLFSSGTVPGGGMTSSHCYIGLVTQYKMLKDCPFCISNPVWPGTGNKHQEETDYVGTGIAPLTFKRIYNSREQFGRTWTNNYNIYITVRSAALQTVATLYRGGTAYAFTYSSGIWVPDADVNYKLTGSDGGFTVITPEGAQELYDGYNKVYMITGLAWEPRYSFTYTSTPAHLPATVSDNFGHTLTLAYDSQDRLLTMTDPAGGVYTYAYDTDGNLASVTYPDTKVRQYVYSELAYTASISQPHMLTGIIDESGARYATFGYSASGLGVLSEHAGGADHYTVSYTNEPEASAAVYIDVPNHVKYVIWTYQPPVGTVVTDPLGTTRSYDFVGLNGTVNVTGSDKPCNGLCSPVPQSQSLDANGNATSKTDFDGNVTHAAYDLARNLQTSRTEAYGTSNARTIATTWHSTFRAPTLITEPNRTTALTYDSNGHLLTRTVTDIATSATRTWTWTYDSYGEVLTENGPRTDLSDVTTRTYYNCSTGTQCGMLHTVTNALSQTTTFNTYNAHGQPLTITDANGVVTTLTYDARERMTSRQIGSETTSFTYWPTGLLKKATLPDSSFLLYMYDDAHRLTKIEDGEGNRVEYTLNAMGSRTAENAYDPSSTLARTRTQVFNSLNQLWRQVGAAGTSAVTTTFGYDSNGNQTSIAAPLSRSIANQYDELERLSQITDPASGTTQFGYDANDNLTSVTDPRSNVTSYTYNGFGDVTQQVSPDTGTSSSTYDSGGNLATSTDARSKTGTYSYDALNRVTSIAYTDLTSAFSYDSGTNGVGHLTGASDANHSLSFTYDAQGRTTGKNQTVGSITKSVSYGYTNGNLTSLTTPSGQTIGYSYTEGRISSITLNGTTTILDQVLYEPFGPVSGWRWGNSTYAVRVYDTDGKPTTIDSAGASDYGYDDAFRITSITDTVDSSKSWTYGYDALDRLNAASKTGQTIGYTYDANGNRLSQTGTQTATYTVAAASNRISSITGTPARTYGYDAAGNTTADGTNTETYTDAGRLKTVTRSGVTTTYIYNALGQRVKKSNSSLTRYFTYDEAGHLLGEYDGSGTLIQETVWLNDIPVATLRPNGAGVSLYYVHTDHLNTPRRISRPSDNAVLWRWDSDPFGTNAANEDPDGDAVAFSYNLRFPGQYFDAESGLNYNYMRDYDPTTGRYLESDPLGVAISASTYGYVDADPIDYVDPYGLAKCTYSISKHTMTCVSNDGTTKKEVGPEGLWSGVAQCTNNPSNQCTASENIGPVPPGNYKMNKDDRPEHKGRNFWRLEPVPKTPGWKCGFPFGARCGFEFHPGSVSLGCITADKTNPEVIKQYLENNSLLLKENGSNTLTVVP